MTLAVFVWCTACPMRWGWGCAGSGLLGAASLLRLRWSCPECCRTLSRALATYFQMSASVIRHQAHPSEDFVVGCFLGFVFLLLLVCLLA